MTAKAEALRSKGKEVLSLSHGEPDFKTPDHICTAAKQAIDSGSYFSYPPTGGYLELRKAIAEKYVIEYNVGYRPENVVVSNGAKQAISNLMLTLLTEGDEVIVLAPYWVSYVAQIRIAGGNPVIVKGDLKNDFKVDPNHIERAINGKTRAIIFSSPSNPTGLVYSREELTQLSQLVSQYPDLLVIADEIYEHINYSKDRVCFASLPGMLDRTITVNGFSKGYAMTGWRVGYLCAPDQIASEIIKLQGHLSSSNCSISQQASIAALKHDLRCVNEMVSEYAKRRDLILSLLSGIEGIKVNKPLGAFYVFPDVSSYYGLQHPFKVENSKDMCEFLLAEAHVAVVPGISFGEDRCIRISYSVSEETLREAIRRIKLALKKLTEEATVQ